MGYGNCKSCGAVYVSAVLFCDACGHSDVPMAVVLASSVAGRTVEVRTAMEMGSRNLSALADPDLRFCSPNQFRLERSLTRGGWVVYPSNTAANPTWLNGVQIPEDGAVLSDGDQLSIKGKALMIQVCMYK
jgi:hypothetical protein